MSLTQHTHFSRHDHPNTDLDAESRDTCTKCDQSESYTNEPTGKEYKPAPLRQPFLTLVLVALLASLILLACAVRTLPSTEHHTRSSTGKLKARSFRTPHISTGSNMNERTTTRSMTELSQTVLNTNSGSELVATITCESETQYVTWTGQGNYGQIGYQTITTVTAPCAVVTETITVGSDEYGSIGYQTITNTIIEQDTVKVTVTETVTETIRETDTETTLSPQPTHAPSSPQLPEYQSDIEVISVTKSFISILSPVLRGTSSHPGDIVAVEGSSTIVPSAGFSPSRELGHGESVNLQTYSFGIGDKPDIMTGQAANTRLTQSGHFGETQFFSKNSLDSKTSKESHFMVPTPYITEVGVVLLDGRGSPTATTTTKISVFPAERGDVFSYTGGGLSSPIVTTLMSSEGSAIATLTAFPNPVQLLLTTTLTGSAGEPTETQVWFITPTSSSSIQTKGGATPTITSTPVPPETYTIVYYISSASTSLECFFQLLSPAF